MNNKCKIGGAGRNESGFLEYSCEFCKDTLSDEQEGKKDCIALIAKESETSNYLYSEVKRYEECIRDMECIVLDDVPHQYQARILQAIELSRARQ